MKLNNLKTAEGSTRTRRRIGRGAGSGLGGTSTRGHKGAKARSGYNVSYKILNAKDFGLAQNRERIYIIASMNGVFDFNAIKPQKCVVIEDILDKEDDFTYLDKDGYTLIDDCHIHKQEKSGLVFVGYKNKSLWKKGIDLNKLYLSRCHRQPNRIYSIKGTHPTLSSQETDGRFYIYNPSIDSVRKLTPNECINLTFTSPPYYNAKEYSHYDTYDKYLNVLKDIFTDVYRLTKEGRFLIINTSPVLVARIDRQHQSKRLAIPFDLHKIITDIGFDFIDDIIWVKPECSVKNRNGQFIDRKKPLAYKPNAITEYVMVYRKHTNRLEHKTI